MTASDITPTIVQTLKDELQGGGDLNLLVGAGASVSAGLPTWVDLAASLVQKSRIAPNLNDAYAFLEGQDILLALEAVKETAKGGGSKGRWERWLTDALYGDVVAEPADFHLSIADLISVPPPQFENVRCATLNYDLLIEDALYERNHPAVPRTAGGGPANTIWHLHGLLGQDGEARDIVLTLTDYLDLTAQHAPWQMNVLQNFRYHGPLVMVGTSYSDMDLRTWFDAFQGQKDALRPAINIVSREGLGLPRAQFEKVLPALKVQWGSLGITVIPVHDHVDAAQLLREIRFFDQPGYAAPSERVARVYNAHSGVRFADAQEEYTAYLDADHQEFASMLDAPCNTTLWLANNDNRLTRWATNGRRYTDEVNLRRIEADQSSAWAVARCFSRAASYTWQDEGPDPEGPSRWCSVVATPIWVELPDAAPLVAGVFTVASTKRLDASENEQVAKASVPVVARWSERLLATCLKP